jgi:hypothetical protein
MIIAAEILRYTTCTDERLAWTDKDTSDFSSNFVVPSVNTFLNGNGYFMNQNGYPNVAAMSGDIFLNDRSAYEKRVEMFAVNKDAPNKGWNFSVQDLARRVDRNAITGEKVDPPVVQLMEMGRDQAHAADDVEVFNNTARLLSAQQTKLDPVTGTVSTKPDAVGPYEFLDDRILAAADFFCRFMLGYDTPWVPVGYDIAPNGEIRAIYPRIADNYRGRLRGLDFWDIHYYYTCRQGVDLAKKAPYYHEAFTKRIINSDTDWIFIPANVTGEGAKPAPREQEPASIEVELRSNLFNNRNAIVLSEGSTRFVRIIPTEAGTRIAILSSDTGKKKIGMRIRTTGPAELKMSALEKPWLLPDTRGQWRHVTYDVGRLERFRDIVFMSFRGFSQTKLDVDALIRDGADKLTVPEFASGTSDMDVVAYVGAPVVLEFSVSTSASGLEISSFDKPQGANLDGKTGAFAWKPSQEGQFSFVVNATNDTGIVGKRIKILVMRDRASAIAKIASAFNQDIPCLKVTIQQYREALHDIERMRTEGDDQRFFRQLQEFQAAARSLRPLTPLLCDGSMNYPEVVEASNLGDAIGLLTDGNDDTFPVYTLAKDLNDVFDFGAAYKVSFDAFAVEGRLNFENRTQDLTFFGSNDAKNWTQLAPPMTSLPVELTRIDVSREHLGERFRYLKIEKNRKSSPLFEPSELRIFGRRHEVN